MGLALCVAVLLLCGCCDIVMKMWSLFVFSNVGETILLLLLLLFWCIYCAGSCFSCSLTIICVVCALMAARKTRLAICVNSWEHLSDQQRNRGQMAVRLMTICSMQLWQ